jgi:hypothetical protein
VIKPDLPLAYFPPSWSPDDKCLAITSADSTIWVITSDGKNKWKIGKGFSPTWSPNGKKIICYANKKTIISYELGNQFQPSKAQIIYHSRNIIETFWPPVFDETGRYLFLHMSGYPMLSFFGIDNYELGIDSYDLVLLNLEGKTIKPLMRVPFPPWEGFAYYPEKKN